MKRNNERVIKIRVTQTHYATAGGFILSQNCTIQYFPQPF